MHTINKLAVPLLVLWQLLPLVSGARAKASQTVPLDAPQQNQTYTIPLKLEPLQLSYPILYVKINGSKPLAFILDTGASGALAITKATQQQLHLKAAGLCNIIDGAALCTGSPDADVKLHVEKGSQLEAMVLPAALSKQFQSVHVAGLIGLPLLQVYSPCRLDFAQQALILNLHEDLTKTMREAAELTLIDKKDGVRYTEVAINASVPAELLIDTGSNATILSQALADQLKLGAIENKGFINVKGTSLSYSALVETLRLGRDTEPNVEVMIAPGPIVLGINFLARFRITLDLAHNKMYLERSEAYAQYARNQGRSIVVVAFQRGKLLVTNVPSWSAAATSGVQQGDELVSVDGMDVGKSSLGTAQSLLDGYEQTMARLVVRRDGEPTDIAYQREPFVRTAAEQSAMSGSPRYLTLKWGGTMYSPDGKPPVVILPGVKFLLPPDWGYVAHPRPSKASKTPDPPKTPEPPMPSGQLNPSH